jgi:hypothetical protein
MSGLGFGAAETTLVPVINEERRLPWPLAGPPWALAPPKPPAELSAGGTPFAVYCIAAVLYADVVGMVPFRALISSTYSSISVVEPVMTSSRAATAAS